MFDSASKTFFHLLARSRVLQHLASRYGMRKPTSFARRFIAGETVAEAIAAAPDGHGVEVGQPGRLFATRIYGGGAAPPLTIVNRHQYAVRPDGQRFLINQLTEGAAATPITVVLNWAGLRK